MRHLPLTVTPPLYPTITITTKEIAMARMFNPPHPGEVLRDGVFTDTGMTVTEFAERMGITHVSLSRVLNARAGINADMAVPLAAALGGSAESWLHLQASYDLWQAQRRLKHQIAKITPVKIAA